MYLHTSYDREFVDLLMYLRGKYPKDLFNMEGIGDQLDIGIFSKNFFLSKNVADVSVDSNSNVDEQTVRAYEAELPKPYFRLNAIYLIWKYMKKLYTTQYANEFVESQITGDIYVNDMHGINNPYCFNFSTYDIMAKGLPFVTKIKSGPPKHLSSFIGQLVHFTVYGSNSVLGAVGLADVLIVASYYVDKLYNDNKDIPIAYLDKEVKQELQNLVYSCNQPFRAAIQSGFYNISIYDNGFLDKMCSEYVFPDGSNPNKSTIQKLQIMFMDLMNETLRITPVTFPVTTACFSVDSELNIQDEEFLKLISEKNLEFAYINIYAGKTSTLSSCCRLRSENDTEYFNQFGAGGTKLGSLGVVTLNLPRIAYKSDGNFDKFYEILKKETELSVRINNVKRHIIQKRIDDGRAPLYDHGFMVIGRQYSTTGLVGINEACEIMGLNILNTDGQDFVVKMLNTVNGINEHATKQYNAPHNNESVPAESSSVKLANKDKLLGYQNDYSLYSNQFIPLTVNADMFDRIKLQGLFDSKLSGGAICHLNVETRLDCAKKQADLIRVAVKNGVIYHAINYNLQQCENEHMTVGKNDKCSICNGEIISNFTRVVGFLTNVKNWNKTRREVDYPNRIFYDKI